MTHSQPSLSPTHLINHLACAHVTQLERRRRAGDLEKPIRKDIRLDLIRQRGLKHEAAYVEHLKNQGLDVVELPEFKGPDVDKAVAIAAEAMKSGADVIVQATLRDGRWSGRADVLLKIERPSKLGAWSYEVVDTKLTQETKGGTVLQLCLYSELLGEIQGHVPKWMYVVKPGAGFEKEKFRFLNFAAYYRSVKLRLEAAVDGPLDEHSYPEPVAHCDVCDWWTLCNAQRRADDHLCFVAGLTALHTDELQRQGIATLAGFAERDEPLRSRPERGNIEAFAKAHRQAKVQLRGREAGEPVHELILPPESGRGLARLPEACGGDIFFDIEGDHFYDDGGLEYLLGYCYLDAAGELKYVKYWATNRADEKAAFERFIDDVMRHWDTWPEMHVYHFAPYEPAAVKRLMGRHGTREGEVDRLLRGERFVDLHAVTRQGVRCSVERYSLKDLEPFHGFTRDADLRESSKARIRLAAALQLGDSMLDTDRELVERYNEEDCLSTYHLYHWLEARRQEAIDQGHGIERPPLLDGAASERVQDRLDDIQRVYEQLIAHLPDDREAWTAEHEALWLLAHQLAYFKREENCAWWEFFRLHELEPEDQLAERKVAAQLTHVSEIDSSRGCPTHRYTFVDQELSFDIDDKVHEVLGDKIGTVVGIDMFNRTLDIKHHRATANIRPAALFVDEVISPGVLPGALLALAETIATHGLDSADAHCAACDLLMKRGPRLRDADDTACRQDGESAVDAARRLARELDHGVLAIQGPPGSGKTYTGARMILDLVQQGHTVGITAVSHKVIRNLLDETHRAAQDAGATIRLAHKIKKESDPPPAHVEELTTNPEAHQAVADRKIVGGTVWLWARDDAEDTLDYLFVDEAGQMSLAQILAAARCAKNLVLLGDPQQLEQPQRGSHPEGSEVAALVHILDGHDTIPADKGLFLDTTWRLHPDICRFTSELYYEHRLEPIAGLEHQRITSQNPELNGSGLRFVPVEHTRRQHSSPEEVTTIKTITDNLLAGNTTWTDRHNTSRPLTEQDILIVAPYNAQVAALKARMPGLSIGTVDKFQGQEAPIVIYSMTSSTAEDAPRGLSFLYNPNRLNVATSRAKGLCILVGSPKLFEAECKTPGQMGMVNGLCRYRELSE